MKRLLATACALGTLGAACVSAPEPYDYSLYLAHTPRSILVLPPLNESVDVDAVYTYFSTVTTPLAELGYYVYPVAMVDLMMRENGLPTPWEMHQVSLAKIDEIFGADAVMYVTIQDWGQSYQVLNSKTEVEIRARMVDVKTGQQLWSGEVDVETNSSSGASEPIGAAISALLSQIFSSKTSNLDRLSRNANAQLFLNPGYGLLLGPHHPDYETSRQALREEMAARAAVQAAEAAGEGGSTDSP